MRTTADDISIANIIDAATLFFCQHDDKGHGADLPDDWQRVIPLLKAAPKLREACGALLDYVNKSNGIDGWHLNGDILPWKKCDAVQLMEAAFAKAEGETE